MRAIATDRVAWSICLSVCLCICVLVTFVSPIRWLNRCRCRFGTDSGRPRKPCIKYGVQIPQGKGNFWGGPVKSIESLRCWLNRSGCFFGMIQVDLRNQSSDESHINVSLAPFPRYYHLQRVWLPCQPEKSFSNNIIASYTLYNFGIYKHILYTIFQRCAIQ